MADNTDKEIESAAKYLLSTHSLLIALVTVASMTFGLFVYDAERALTKLDKVEESSTATATQVQVIAVSVKALSQRADHADVVLNDHEHRITVLEADDPKQRPR